MGRAVRHRGLVIGGGMMSFVVLACVLVPVWLPHSLTRIDPITKLRPPSWMAGAEPGRLLGTDQLGRDLLARTLIGGRMSLLVGLVAVLGSGVIGVGIGALAGYLGGWADRISVALADIQLAIPTVLLAVLLIASIGGSVESLLVVLALSSWVVFARTVRASFLAIREQPYVEAARALGASHFSIVVRHILRNAWTPVLVIATQRVALMITLESSLSFLGIGVPPSIPTWGAMVRDGRAYLESAWWVALWPGSMLALTVLGINFLGDGLRDWLDPRLR